MNRFNNIIKATMMLIEPILPKKYKMPLTRDDTDFVHYHMLLICPIEKKTKSQNQYI